jgi:hypothetical protein
VFETLPFANTVPGTGISPAMGSPLSFGASQATETPTAAGVPVAGAYDPARQVTAEAGVPLALSAAERTPYETREDSQTWTDREA